MECNPAGDCWCKALPSVPMPAGDEFCLCEACLRAKIDASPNNSK